MRLTAKANQEFKQIYKKEFGADLADREAEEMALRVLRLFYVLLQRPSDDSEHLPKENTFDNSKSEELS
jgi:hypothetical protein